MVSWHPHCKSFLELRVFVMFKIQKIIILRALKLGDMLCSIPAFRAIRIDYPESHIALAGHPMMEKMLSRYSHYIDEFVPFAGFPGMAESPIDPQVIWQTIKTIQDKEFDLAVQLHGSGEVSNIAVSLFNAKNSIGYYSLENFRPNSLYQVYPSKLHEVDR